MSSKSTAELFDHFVEVINQAQARKNIYDIPKAAEAAGMEGGESHGGFTQRWEYRLTDAAGQTLEVKCRWWDQSKAFSIQPDMHVMSVEILQSNPPKFHERRYEE